jgi:hypothetical protein
MRQHLDVQPILRYVNSTAWPLAARAQRSATPVIGYLNSRSSGADPRLLEAFHQGLKETGVEGQNVAIEYRFGEDHNERLPALAAELIQREVAVIVANGPAVMSAKAATASIPIVFAVGFDPVQLGLVASLNHPGGNITGVVASFDEIGPKKLELAHDLIPTALSFAALLNPTIQAPLPKGEIWKPRLRLWECNCIFCTPVANRILIPLLQVYPNYTRLPLSLAMIHFSTAAVCSSANSLFGTPFRASFRPASSLPPAG